MEKNNLKELTLEQLKQRSMLLKVLTWSLAGMLFLLLCITLYQAITEEKMQVLMVVPLALSSILVINFINLKKLALEIRARESM